MSQIDVFVTSIMSSTAIRGRHERVIRGLESLHVPFQTHDVASSDEAKTYWKRKNESSNELPCVVVDGKRVGSIEQFDEAVEFNELRQFLGLDKPEAAPSAAATASAVKSDESKAATDTKSGTATGSATLDDFSALNLTPEELKELEREIAAGESFSGAAENAWASRSYAPAKALKPDEIKRVGFEKAPKPARPDVLADMPGLSDEQAQALANEIEREEAARAKAKELPVEPRPDQEVAMPAATSTTDDASVGAVGGAELSAPVDELAKLDLSREEAKDLLEGPTAPVASTLAVSAAVEPDNPWTNDSETDDDKPKRKTSVAEIKQLKSKLNQDFGDTGKGSSELSSFGTERKIASVADDTQESVDA